MPPQKRTSSKAEDSVKVEPASAAHPRATTPSKKAVAAAVEKSAEYLEQQDQPPEDIHPRATTPSKASVEEAVEQSAEYLRRSGQAVDSPATTSRDKTLDAAPVSAGGTNPGLDAQPTYSGRDKTADAAPTFSSPVLDNPQD